MSKTVARFKSEEDVKPQHSLRQAWMPLGQKVDSGKDTALLLIAPCTGDTLGRVPFESRARRGSTQPGYPPATSGEAEKNSDGRQSAHHLSIHHHSSTIYSLLTLISLIPMYASCPSRLDSPISGTVTPGGVNFLSRLIWNNDLIPLDYALVD